MRLASSSVEYFGFSRDMVISSLTWLVIVQSILLDQVVPGLE
jgi:hypothetical protein